MWPRRRSTVQEVLRAGRHAVERWAGPSAALALVGSHPLAGGTAPDAAALLPAIQALFATKPQQKVTVLLESAWLPLLLVEVGTAPLGEAQVELLLRHRLNLLLGDSGASTASWLLRTDYRAGERFALGYAMPPVLRQALVAAGEAMNIEWSALLPAFAWGLDHLLPARAWPQQSGWWAWPEQDRLLLARLERGRAVALNSGAALTADPAQIGRMVAVEALRSGYAVAGAPALPMARATWTPTPSVAVVA